MNDAIIEARKALSALYCEVHASIADDVRNKVERAFSSFADLQQINEKVTKAAAGILPQDRGRDNCPQRLLREAVESWSLSSYRAWQPMKTAPEGIEVWVAYPHPEGRCTVFMAMRDRLGWDSQHHWRLHGDPIAWMHTNRPIPPASKEMTTTDRK